MKNSNRRATLAMGLQLLFCIIYAVITLFVQNRLLDSNMRLYLAFSIPAASFMLLSVITFFLIKLAAFKREDIDEDSEVPDEVPLTLYNCITVPVAICSEDSRITWANKAFKQLIENSESKTRSFRSITGFNHDVLLEREAEGGVKWTLGDKIYLIRGKRTVKEQIVVWWEDITELEATQTKLAEEETLVAYIMIDNLDEIVQIEQENTASVASSISHKLIDWASNVNGILKEYERNKFIFTFSAVHLKKFIESKFDILDQVRWIPIGKSDFPATISIGVSTVSGTLREKEIAAQSAIELALARGGDQVVIKSANGVEFIGGITKTSQKRSTVKSRTIAEKLVSLMYDSSNILIMGHKYADFDAFGACVGIARLAMHCNKPCYIVGNRNDEGLAKCYDNLKSLHAYDNVFVTSSEAIELNYSDTLLVIVDVNNPTQYESPDLARAVRKTVFIDHHRMTGEFVKTPVMHYIEPSASSACELISEILEQTLVNGKLTKQEANMMFAGIMLDTKRFVVNTGVRTFSAAQYLRGQGANPTEAQEFFKTGLDDMLRKAKFETNVQIYRKTTAIAVNLNEDNTAADRIAAAKVADNLLTVEGVLASFAVCSIDNIVRISARSTGKVNVQKILESIGGGGHYDSAATQMNGVTIEDALISLKQAIDAYLDS